MDWLQFGQTVGGPLFILAAVMAGFWKLGKWAKPHADNYMADIRANSTATRELIKTLGDTQVRMTQNIAQIGQFQEMLARSDQRTSRALVRLVGTLEARPCVGAETLKLIEDSDDFTDKEDSSSDA
jgi:hypothetical protein